VSAGYSAAPQARKLGLKPGLRIALDQPPPGWALLDAPEAPSTEPGAAVDVLIAFFITAESLRDRLPALAQRIHPLGALWVAWPRRAGGHQSDITGDLIRELALPLGIVDVKVAAIDTDWSGHRFVWRRAKR
jgi:hypothetical protein